MISQHQKEGSSGAEESSQLGSLPSNIGDLLKQATTEVESSIRNFELALESGLVDENIWQLLAYLYLGTSRIDKLGNLDRQYEETFGRTFSSILSQQKIRIDSNRIVFEMPQKSCACLLA